ncbi:hypothetical protein ABW20_dc0109959 [Dactylellina cionopaga]|nr:hypothetical protein ABW20_dc0109959 [Dactylellina cionopaga]
MPPNKKEYDITVYCTFKKYFKGWGGKSENRNGIKKVINKNAEKDQAIKSLMDSKGLGTVIRALQDLLSAKAFNNATKFETLFPKLAHPGKRQEKKEVIKPDMTDLEVAKPAAEKKSTVKLGSKRAKIAQAGIKKLLVDGTAESEAGREVAKVCESKSLSNIMRNRTNTDDKDDKQAMGLDSSKWASSSELMLPPKPTRNGGNGKQEAGKKDTSCLKPRAARGEGANKVTKSRVSPKPTITKRAKKAIIYSMSEPVGIPVPRAIGNRVQEKIRAMERDAPVVGTWAGPLATATQALPQEFPEVPSRGLVILGAIFPVEEQRNILADAQRHIKNTLFNYVKAATPGVLSSLGASNAEQIKLVEYENICHDSKERVSFAAFGELEDVIEWGTALAPHTFGRLIRDCASAISTLEGYEGDEKFEDVKKKTLSRVFEVLNDHGNELHRRLKALEHAKANVLTW